MNPDCWAIEKEREGEMKEGGAEEERRKRRREVERDRQSYREKERE